MKKKKKEKEKKWDKNDYSFKKIGYTLHKYFTEWSNDRWNILVNNSIDISSLNHKKTKNKQDTMSRCCDIYTLLLKKTLIST